MRFYDWADRGYGLKVPVLFTARSGATLSGTVRATRAGPARKPAVVITTGSVQAPETLYWGLAAALAKSRRVLVVGRERVRLWVVASRTVVPDPAALRLFLELSRG